MVDASYLKVYKTTNNLGGAITGTQVINATPNNVFTNVPNNERVVGEDYYACIYFKNTHTTEAMDNFKLWPTSKTAPPDTELKWGFDPTLTSINFDGSNDYVDCTNDATLWSQGLTKFSFSFWIFPTAGWDGQTRRIVDHDAATAHGINCYIHSSSTGEIHFEIRNAANSLKDAMASTLTLNTWNFIVCVYDSTLGSANLKIYRNAVVGDTIGNLTETINKSAVLLLAGLSNRFKGNMKDFRWWTTKALSQTDVTNLYEGSETLVTTPDYWLKMNEGTGNPVDFITNSKVGTLNGATWNTSAQTIADKYTSPSDIDWQTLGVQPSTPNYGKLAAGASFPVWLWLHVNANAISRIDDGALFAFNFNIPQGGSGSGGSGATTGYHFDPYGTFDSVDDCIQVADDASLDLSTFTVACWFKTSHDFTDAEGTLVRKGFGFYQTSADVKNYFIKINNEPFANTIEAGFEELDGTLSQVNSGGTTYNDGLWHFVAVTYDQVNIRLYVDGVDIYNYAVSATPGTNARELYIGADPDEPISTSHRVYYGDLDEVRVWNVGLTSTEVSNLYTTGTVPQESAIVYENTFGGSGGNTGGGGGTGGNPPPVNADYKIAVVGDEGCESETDDVIDLIQSEGYDHVVSVGDHAYASASCWTTRFTPLKSIMNSAYGNHEYSESGGISPYKTFFGHSLTYFTYKFQNILFLVIDTNIDSDIGSTQHNVIKSALEAAANDNTITWKIAIMHHPWYGASSDHSYNEFNQRQNFHALFDQHKVSFVCVGHNHNLQRTYQLRYNPTSNGSPTVIDSTSPYSRDAIGLIHVVTGAGGHDHPGTLYSLGSQPSYQAYQSNSYNGIWEIIASNNGQTLTCSFVNLSGDREDTFVINAP